MTIFDQERFQILPQRKTHDGVSFQSVNSRERGKTKPLPIVLKQIEAMVKEMGDREKGSTATSVEAVG